MNETIIKARLREESREGKIPCAKALGIAEESGISPREVGRLANALGIKISACQLGCFD